MTETKAPQSKRKTPPDPESESWRKLVRRVGACGIPA